MGVSLRDVELFKELFDLLGAAGKARLAPSDLRNALRMFGFHAQQHTVYQIIAEIDPAEQGGIAFPEFLKAMTDQRRPCDEDAEEDHRRIFNYFAGEKPFIAVEDIERVCREVNEPMEAAELTTVMERLDPAQRAQCDFRSFHKAMLEAVARKPLVPR